MLGEVFWEKLAFFVKAGDIWGNLQLGYVVELKIMWAIIGKVCRNQRNARLCKVLCTVPRI